ncbi:cupin domain-containing protein [Nitrosococcus oceani]|uniref:cupin domain-containing protein n=1 Tax=Nitrosococcus oceani TaxID=1229 RepID=UPI0004E90561|nr:cupin domain-containing protein [Nitrosococcus oceani]KFI22893.1 hypothetical protein HW44_06755 [Nitrosococcus oceani]
MNKILLTILLSIGINTHLNAADITQLLNVDIPPLPDNQEVVMLTVELQPGETSSPHKHNAHTFVYTLEGNIMMQVKGKKEKVLNPGDTFYETPDEIHTVMKNMSNIKEGKLLVFFIKTKGDPISVPH